MASIARTAEMSKRGTQWSIRQAFNRLSAEESRSMIWRA